MFIIHISMKKAWGCHHVIKSLPIFFHHLPHLPSGIPKNRCHALRSVTEAAFRSLGAFWVEAPKAAAWRNQWRSLEFFDFIYVPMINMLCNMGSIFMVYIFVFLYISIFEMLNISCYGWNVFDFKLVHMAKLMANFALAGTLTHRQILETSQVDKWSTRRNRFLATRSARFGQCHGLHPSIDPFSAIGLRHGDRCLLGHGCCSSTTPPVRSFGKGGNPNEPGWTRLKSHPNPRIIKDTIPNPEVSKNTCHICISLRHFNFGDLR